MNRRQFLRNTALVAGSAWAVSSWSKAQGGAVSGEFVPLRRGAGYYRGRGGAMGWLANDDAVLAIDSQFPDNARHFFENLPGRRGRSLNLLINTHHHRDHTSGNVWLRDHAPMMMAHSSVPELMCAEAEAGGRELDPRRVPNGGTTGGLRLGFGSETVRFDYLGPAHTRGDLVITLEQAGAVHLGDLCFNRRYPRIDRPGGARIDNWILLLERVARDWPSDTIFIFGHAGEGFDLTGTGADLLAFRDYLDGLREHVAAEVAAGKSKSEITKLANLPGFTDYHVPSPNRLQGNLEAAFEEIAAGQSAD